MLDLLYISRLVAIWDSGLNVANFILRMKKSNYENIRPDQLSKIVHIFLLKEMDCSSKKYSPNDSTEYFKERWNYFYVETKELSAKEEKEISVFEISSIWTFSDYESIKEFWFLLDHPIYTWIDVLVEKHKN